MPGMRGAFLTAALLAVAMCPAAIAQPAPPALTDTVNDFAHVIDSASRAELDKRIRALQQATGDVVVVATVPTYQPYADINEYAVKMFENGGHGIGKKGKDNGLLIVVAVNDHRVRVEVGYDLEGLVTDGYAGETIRNDITPEFRKGDYGAGLVAGTTRIINHIADGRGVSVPDVPRQQPAAGKPHDGGIPLSTIIFVAILLIILARGNRRRRRRFWGGGPWSGWTGGVGPFGGGGFGGGFGGLGGGGGGGGGGLGGLGGGGGGGGGASGSW
jgi:uncharacterized protein